MKNFLFIGMLTAVIAMPVIAQETPIRNSADSTTRHHVAHKKTQQDKEAQAKQAVQKHKKHRKHKKVKRRSAASEN